MMKTWLGKFLRNGGYFLLGLALVWSFRTWYMQPNFSGGEMAANFSATSLNGESFQLSDFRGRFVLLHFWGSWCAPCRRQNPALVATIRQLGLEKIQPISIAIEKDSSRWQKAIQQDGLFWPHQVLDATNSLKFLNGPISDLYGVNQVPTDFLIGPKGDVLALNPSFQQIQQIIRDAR